MSKNKISIVRKCFNRAPMGPTVEPTEDLTQGPSSVTQQRTFWRKPHGKRPLRPRERPCAEKRLFPVLDGNADRAPTVAPCLVRIDLLNHSPGLKLELKVKTLTTASFSTDARGTGRSLQQSLCRTRKDIQVSWELVRTRLTNDPL